MWSWLQEAMLDELTDHDTRASIFRPNWAGNASSLHKTQSLNLFKHTIFNTTSDRVLACWHADTKWTKENNDEKAEYTDNVGDLITMATYFTNCKNWIILGACFSSPEQYKTFI